MPRPRPPIACEEPTPGGGILLAVPPFVRRYGPAAGQPGAAELAERLRQQAVAAPSTIHDPRDAMLNRQGLVQRRYRYTTTALGQLCSQLAAGLAHYVADIAGLRAGERDEGWLSYSPLSAIKAINEAIQVRFASRLAGCGLIIDARQRRIEGVVGPRYHFYGNHEFFAFCEAFARGLRPPALFHEATIAGRWLLVRYRDPAPLFSLETPEGPRAFYRGWHFVNSEVGDCAVRTGVALFGEDGAAALLPSGKVSHLKGNAFAERLEGLAERLRREAEGLRPEALRAQLARLQQTPLALGRDPANYARRINEWIGRLARGRTCRRSAQRAVLYALSRRGAEGGGLRALLEPRTAYDLFCGLGAVAARLLPEQREPVEETAYRLLTQRIRWED